MTTHKPPASVSTSVSSSKAAPQSPASKKAGPPVAKAVTAVEMGARQREISVSEFFTKNRHLLGFDRSEEHTSELQSQ